MLERCLFWCVFSQSGILQTPRISAFPDSCEGSRLRASGGALFPETCRHFFVFPFQSVMRGPASGFCSALLQRSCSWDKCWPAWSPRRHWPWASCPPLFGTGVPFYLVSSSFFYSVGDETLNIYLSHISFVPLSWCLFLTVWSSRSAH